MSFIKFLFSLGLIAAVYEHSLLSAAQKCLAQRNQREIYVCQNVKTMVEIVAEMNDDWRGIIVKNPPTWKFRLTVVLPPPPVLRRIEYFDLSHNHGLDIEKSVGFQTFNGMKVLNISHCDLASYEGNFFPRNSVVEVLDASSNDLNQLDASNMWHLLNLRYANFSKNSLKRVASGTFEALQELVHLDLNENLLTSADIGPCRKLKYLDLGNNNIKILKTTDFTDLPSLSELLLTANALEHIEDRAFYDLHQLTLLDLSGNRLKQLSPEAFRGLSHESLIYLNLSSNDLSTLTPQQFVQLPQLQVLDISSNRLEALDYLHFQGLSNLRKLYAQDNDIINISLHTFSNMSNVDYIDLSSNNIKHFHEEVFGFKTLPRMRKLLLNMNNIESLSAATFAALPYLEYLSLGNNELRSLEPRIFERMFWLRKLHLGNNYLEEIPQPTLNSISGVAELLLDNNKLTFLPDVSVEFPNLRRVAVEGNPWQCMCLNEIYNWLKDKGVEHIRRQSPYYMGKKPLCILTSSASCKRDLNYVKEQNVVAQFERLVGV